MGRPSGHSSFGLTLRAQQHTGGDFMQAEESSAGGSTLLALKGNADVSIAQQLHRQLSESIATSKTVTVDCNQLDYLDVACVQILLAAKQVSDVAVSVGLDPQTPVAQCLKHAGLLALLTGENSTAAGSTQETGANACQ